MPVLALVGNKGGAGKTTLCVNLASALSAHAPTVLLDADPQRSALHWRASTDRAGVVAVVDANHGLEAQIRDTRLHYEYLVRVPGDRLSAVGARASDDTGARRL